jgi:hypothetical protein
MTQVHHFDSTGDAYDASQCDENAHDGDILAIPDEGVWGILFKAWPVAVTNECGAFHQLAEGGTWDDFEGGRYAAAAAEALRLSASCNS